MAKKRKLKLRPISRAVRDSAAKATWLMDGIDKSYHVTDSDQSPDPSKRWEEWTGSKVAVAEKPVVEVDQKTDLVKPETSAMDFWSTVEKEGKLDSAGVFDVGYRSERKEESDEDLPF